MVLSKQLFAKNIRHDSWWPNWDSNLETSECNSEMLHLSQLSIIRTVKYIFLNCNVTFQWKELYEAWKLSLAKNKVLCCYVSSFTALHYIQLDSHSHTGRHWHPYSYWCYIPLKSEKYLLKQIIKASGDGI